MSGTVSEMMSAMMEYSMPYLRAIQKLPGNTASEKFTWIGRLASRDQKAGGDRDKVSQELQPLLQVEIAIKKNTPEYQKYIISALQSEDSMLNQRALKATWFFNGNCKATINAEYFCKHIFPNVSLRTRTSIIKTLANQLTGKDPEFAEELFAAITSDYDIQTACPLIVACKESFAYDTIVKKRLILPYPIVKKIYRINSNLAVRYLELLKPSKDNDPFAIGIEDYSKILEKLVKKHLESFIKICITHESCFLPLSIALSKTSAGIFLKKAKNHLLTHPKIFLKMLPIKMISADVMEIIFPKVLPDKHDNFSIKIALETLEFYPKEKKTELLFKSYKDKYNVELDANLNNVTPELLQILPTEKRVELARSKRRQEDRETFYLLPTYKTTWICYHTTKEAIPLIKESLRKAANVEDRIDHIAQLIYCCKVNEDNETLAEVIKYIIDKHKNERSLVCDKIMGFFSQIYKDAFSLDKRLQSLIFDMIRQFYVRHGSVEIKLIASLAQYRLINKLPITDLMEILIGLNAQSACISFNILQKYPKYERKCLEIIATIMHNKYPPTWAKQDNQINDTVTDEQKKDLIELIRSMYNFNDRCKKLYPNVKRLSIADYPHLLDGVFTILKPSEHSSSTTQIRQILMQNEPKLYYSMLPMENNIANLMSHSGVHRLKKNPLNILNNWEMYLEECRERCDNKYVQRFVRATRWYQTVPIKFAERCIKDLQNGNKYKMSSALIILSLLLHGDTLTKIIKSLISKINVKTVTVFNSDAREDYLLVKTIPVCIKISNPPVSFDIMTKFSEGDFFSTMLVALMNISKRSSLKKVSSFAQKLISMRVGVRKFGIRLLLIVSSRQEYIDYLDCLWSTEKNLSIRQILLDATEEFFLKNPCAKTWSLYCKIISTATDDDSEIIFSKMQLNVLMQRRLNTVSYHGITQCIALWYATITLFYKNKTTNRKLNKNLGKFVDMLNNLSVLQFVPDEIANTIIKKYLFHSEDVVSLPSRKFAILYIFSEDQTKLPTRKALLIETIRSAITRWNEPHPMKFCFYPVNNTIHNFIIDFTNKCLCSRNEQSFNPQILDDISAIFKSCLLPIQDAKSYLLLEYTRILLKCTSENVENTFGLRLGLFVPHLVEIFTPLLVPFMAKTLNEFLKRAYNDNIIDNNIKRKVMEGLIESEHIPSIVIAVILLSYETRNRRYDDLIRKFMEIDHPAVTTILYNYLNTEENCDTYDWNKY